VTRFQKDLGAGSTFGFGATAVRRNFPDQGELEQALARQAYAGGVDWNFRFADQSHEFGGFFGGSFVEGEARAIERLQGSSARYFQRPDADYVDLVRTRTSLSGYTAGARLGRIEGAWRWTLSGEARSPGFEINDAGAMATADDMLGFGQLAYGTPLARGPWQRLDAAVSLASGWNFGGVRQFTTQVFDLQLAWRNFWKSYARVARDYRALSDNLTRGGPLMGTGAGWRSSFGLSSNYALRAVWALDGSYANDELGGRGFGASTRLLLRLRDRFSVSVEPGYEQQSGVRQFFTTELGGSPATFGRRYVFGALDQSTIYTRLRAGLALTPNLGCNAYVELFASSGSYDRLGELSAARSRELRIYGTDGTSIARQPDGSYLVTDGAQSFTLDNNDFDVASYRTTAVLHWDYRQGSTLFLVWTQNRAEQRLFGDPVGPGDLFGAFDAPGEDVFQVKLSFRLGLE
jgi:hypothetical protein